MTTLPAWSRRPNKYGAIKTPYAGRTYGSKAQAAYAAELDLRQRAGEIRAWIPEVSIPLPQTGARMRVDFLLIMPDGSYRWQDVKGGNLTEAWKLRQRIVRDAYGIEVEVVQRRARR